MYSKPYEDLKEKLKIAPREKKVEPVNLGYRGALNSGWCKEDEDLKKLLDEKIKILASNAHLLKD